MNKIQIFSDLQTIEDIKDFLSGMSFSESFCPVSLMDTHFFVINRTAQSYELSNVTKRISTKLDATTDVAWRPKLMEYLLESAYLEPYFIRLKPNLYKKAEKFRVDRGISKSALGNLIFSEYFTTHGV